MALERNNQVTMTGPRTGVAGAETVPAFGKSFGRELTGRLLPPLLAVTSVIAIWWLLFLLPRVSESLPGIWRICCRAVFHCRCRNLRGNGGDGRAFFSACGGARS